MKRVRLWNVVCCGLLLLCHAISLSHGTRLSWEKLNTKGIPGRTYSPNRKQPLFPIWNGRKGEKDHERISEGLGKERGGVSRESGQERGWRKNEGGWERKGRRRKRKREVEGGL